MHRRAVNGWRVHTRNNLPVHTIASHLSAISHVLFSFFFLRVGVPAGSCKFHNNLLPPKWWLTFPIHATVWSFVRITFVCHFAWMIVYVMVVNTEITSLFSVFCFTKDNRSIISYFQIQWQMSFFNPLWPSKDEYGHFPAHSFTSV